MPRAIRVIKKRMSSEKARQLREKRREQARQIVEQCKNDLGAPFVKVAMGGKEWNSLGEKCPDHEPRRSSLVDGQACLGCQAIGIWDWYYDDSQVRHTAYHEILHILTGLHDEHNWLIDICANILVGKEVKSSAEQRLIEEWGEFLNARDPFPDRKTLKSIIKERMARRFAEGKEH